MAEEVIATEIDVDEEDGFYESISFEAGGEIEVPTSTEPPAKDPEPEIELESDTLVDKKEHDDSSLSSGLSITKDIVNISSTVAMKGFQWASIGTEYGFGWTNGLLEASMSVLEKYDMKDSYLAKGVNAAQAAVEVAHTITVAGIKGSEYVTAKSHAWADATLESAGVKDGALYKLMARKLMQNDDAGDAVVSMIEFFYEFCEGHDIPLQQLPRALILLSQLHQLCLKKPTQYNSTILDDQALRVDLNIYHNFVLGAAGLNVLKLQGLQPVLDLYTSEDECTARLAGIDEADILYRLPSSSVYMSSVYVALHRVRREICVVFSGTSSHHDLLTDLTCRTVPWQCHDQELEIHEGFARTVDLLEPILLPLVKEFRSQHQVLDVVCIGYSFGAAIASLLTLKWVPIFPTVKAYAFAPPGVAMQPFCEVTAQLRVPLSSIHESSSAKAEAVDGERDLSADYPSSSASSSGAAPERYRITGVILGNDMVPRLSKSSAEDLRDCISYLLQNTEVMSDIEDALQRYESLMAKSAAAVVQEEPTLPALEGDSDEQFHECSEDAVQLVAMLSEFDAIYRELVDTHCYRKGKLLPVGRLLYLEDVTNTVTSSAEPRTRILEARAALFAGIVVSGNMLTSHLNNAYKAAIDCV